MPDDDSPLHAADEPTAMWDESALDELAELRGGSAKQKTPATPVAAKPAARSPVLMWIVTLVAALLLGGGAYALVRFLR